METSKIEIPGIDAEVALDLIDGDMEIYEAVLKSFVDNTPEVLEGIKNVTQENLSDYAINIHGIKGICAGIGAVNTSARAKKLELIAKSGDLSGVLAENEDFLKEAKKLVEDISNWLKGN